MLRTVLFFPDLQIMTCQVGAKSSCVQSNVATGDTALVAAGAQSRAHGKIACAWQKDWNAYFAGIGSQNFAKRASYGAKKTH